MRGKLLRIGRFLFLCLIVFIFTFSVTTANAQTLVFSNFDVADCNSLRNIVTDSWGSRSIAFPFQPSASGYVSDIWLQATSNNNWSNSFEVALMTDSGGLPGTVMETWSFDVPRSMSGTLLHGTGTGTTAISEGVTYWLAATLPGDPPLGTSVGWCTSAVTGDYSMKNALGFIGGWYYAGGSNACAFRIAVNNKPPQAVPSMTEWGIVIFMALAGLGSVYFLRRQRPQGVK